MSSYSAYNLLGMSALVSASVSAFSAGRSAFPAVVYRTGISLGSLASLSDA